MIVFDLNCGAGHVFEAWFGSQADYDGQRNRGLVSCPVCGDAGIDKAPMAPRIASPRIAAPRIDGPRIDAPGDRPPASDGDGDRGGGGGGGGGGGAVQIDPKAMMRAMMVAQARMLSGSEDVGPRFAAEARAIHEGDAEHRVIHGQATAVEARQLLADGVPVTPLPFPVRDTARDN